MALNKNVSPGNFYCMVNGQAGGYLESFTPPSLEVEKISASLGPDLVQKFAGGRVKFGKCKLVTNISEANALWELIESVMKKNCQEFECVFGIADQNYKSIREIEMTECLMESVSAKSLDAKDGKSMQQITCEFAVGDVKYVNGSGSVIKGNLSNKAKSWQTSYWDVLGLYNIPAESITKIDLPKHTVKMVEEHTGMRRLPTKTSGAYTCEGLKVSGSAAHNGYEAARDLCIKLMYDGVLTENEFQDWSVNVKDPSHKKVLGEILFIQSAPFKFTTGAEAKVGDAPLQWEMEMFCEQSFIKLAEKSM